MLVHFFERGSERHGPVMGARILGDEVRGLEREQGGKTRGEKHWELQTWPAIEGG